MLARSIYAFMVAALAVFVRIKFPCARWRSPINQIPLGVSVIPNRKNK
jgi:hypothetical protein